MKITLLLLLMLCGFPLVYAQQPQRYDVLISEIMANPSTSQGLPDFKYMELYNASSNAYNLNGWQLSDGNATAIIKADFILQPDSFVLICSGNAAIALSAFGTAIGVTSFPLLRVNGDMLLLRSAENLYLHAVEYDRNWYANEVKSGGGWSLEMIDTKNPCSGASNWKASTDAKGGTPGQFNSIAGSNKDAISPKLLRAYTSDSLHIMLVFDETLDSLTAAAKENYRGSDGLNIELAVVAPPLFNTVTLQLNSPLIKDRVYTLRANALRDCSGNFVDSGFSIKTGIAQIPFGSDLVINEILFNPPADGADYVELYNRSKHIINARSLFIASRNSSGNLTTLKQVSMHDILIFPGDFIVITENASIIQQHYLAKKSEAFIEVPSMPSFANASGKVVLLNSMGDVVDELSYDEKWHFGLINNYKGVALERIAYDAPTQDKNNWHSAAASAGYGTPTYQNSQIKVNEQLQGEINTSPRIFSPDNDGHDDFLTIAYHFPQPGYVCNITVFDARGRTVRYLVRNGICGSEGYFRWDGLNEKNQEVGMGIYIVLTEVYNLQGKTKKFKQVATLARLRF